MLNAFRQSFEQEFKPDVDDIQRLGKEVTNEITLAKALADRQDQELQKKERVAASRQRSTLKRFIPKIENELDEIKKLQLLQSIRQSSEYIRSRGTREDAYLHSDEERQRLVGSLSSHDHMAPFKEACKKRQCGTAEWIHTTPEFIRWYDGTGSPLLWCSGKSTFCGAPFVGLC